MLTNGCAASRSELIAAPSSRYDRRRPQRLCPKLEKVVVIVATRRYFFRVRHLERDATFRGKISHAERLGAPIIDL